MSETDEPGEIDAAEPDVEFVGAASPIEIELAEVYEERTEKWLAGT
jgi:hypothetical protein